MDNKVTKTIYFKFEVNLLIYLISNKRYNQGKMRAKGQYRYGC